MWNLWVVSWADRPSHQSSRDLVPFSDPWSPTSFTRGILWSNTVGHCVARYAGQSSLRHLVLFLQSHYRYRRDYICLILSRTDVDNPQYKQMSLQTADLLDIYKTDHWLRNVQNHSLLIISRWQGQNCNLY